MKRRVPRDGVNDVREYPGIPPRSSSLPEGISADPRVAWRAQAGRGTVGAPAVGDRVIAIATVDRWVYALDSRTGQTYWRYRGEGPFGTGPLMANGRVYAATEGRGGALVALDIYSGKRRWRTAVGDVSAPLVLRDSVIFGATHIEGLAFAVNAVTGKLLWSRAIGQSLSGPLLTRGGLLLVATLDDTLFVMNAATGVIAQRLPLPVSTASPLAQVDDSTVVLTSPSGNVIGITIARRQRPEAESAATFQQSDVADRSPRDLAIRWNTATSAPVLGAPIVWQDTVFALTTDCHFWTIPVASPAAATKLKLDCGSVTPPTLSRDGVLVATVRGEVALFDRSSGKRLWERHAGGELRHPPISRNKQIIVASILGNVVSFR